MFTITLLSRDFSTPLPLSGLDWSVERMAWRAVGGAETARLRVVTRSSDTAGLFALAERLRCPITIHDDLGPCWWGCISAVTFYGGPAPLRIDLDQMTNRVAVSYQEITPYAWSGPRGVTDWAEDAASVAAYGVREKVYTVGLSTPADASALAAAMLGQYREPLLRPHLGTNRSPGPAGGAEGKAMYAVVEARGWWSALGWQYYREPRGQTGHLTVGTGYNWGSTATNAQVAGSFQVATAEGWPASEVWVRLKRIRATDTVCLSLCADSFPAGAPGAVLSTASLPAAALADDWTWARFSLPAPVPLEAGAAYWLVLSRSGAVSATQYYQVSLDEGLGYPAGVFRVWNGSGWAARVPDADLNFLVTGAAPVSDQAARMLASCPFFTRTRSEAGPGAQARLYRDGSRRTLEEVEDLLKLGAGAPPTRLLAAVEPDRLVRVYPCPERPSGGGLGFTGVWLGLDGVPCAENGRPLHPSEQPFGQWLRLSASTPPAGPEHVFVEGVVWEAGRMRVE